MYAKFVVVVDDDINIRDWKDVIWAITTRVDPTFHTLLADKHVDRLPCLCVTIERPGQQDGAGRHQQGLSARFV